MPARTPPSALTLSCFCRSSCKNPILLLVFQPLRAFGSPLSGRLCPLSQPSCRLRRFAASTRVSDLLSVCHSLLALFLRLVSFIVNHLQLLVPKTGGGYTLRHPSVFRSPLFAADRSEAMDGG